MTTRSRFVFLASGIVAGVLALSGCSGFPVDPDGSLDRIRETGELRVGASPAGELVVTGDRGPSGTLVEVVDDYASSIDAELIWTIDSEEKLVDRLEAGSLDLVIGGMTDATPWSDRAGVTRGYPALSTNGEDAVVVLAPMGENRLLVSLETFLDEVTSG